MNPQYKKALEQHISDTVDLLEKVVDKTIWRTSLRIHECIMNTNDTDAENPFLHDRFQFLYFLLFMTSQGFVQMTTGRELYMSWERFEEALNEPVLYEDLEDLWGLSARATLTEIIALECQRAGMNFDETKQKLSSINPSNIGVFFERLKRDGIPWANIFYKFPKGTHEEKGTVLPELPVCVE